MAFNSKTLLAAASTLALMAAAPAIAANDQPNKAAANAQAESSMAIKADDLIGKDIHNAAGEEIGEVESVIIDGSGKVAAVIVGVGGFLGIGERDVAIDWQSLQMNKADGNIRVGMSRAQLEALPPYKFERDEYRRKAFSDKRYLDNRMAAADRTMDRKANWVAAKGMRLSKLMGADVVNPQGETIGEVDDIVMVDGRTHLVLSVGEFLGIGGHHVAIAMDKADIRRDADDKDDLRVSMAMTREQLKALPKYDLDKWETMGR